MIFSAGYQILILFVPLVTTPYVTRIFSPNQIGIYAASLAIVSFFVVGAAFGLPLFGSREIAKSTFEKRDRLFYEFFSLQFLTSIGFYVVFLIIAVIFKLSKYYYLQSLLILVNIFDVSWFYIGIEEIKRTLYRNFLSKIFTMVSIFIFVKTKNDLNIYIGLNIMGMLLGNLLMIFQLRRFIKAKFIFIWPDFNMAKRSFGILISQMISSAKSSFDRIILLALTGSNSFVGIYDQGRKIINIIIAVSNSATIALLPKMTSTMQDKTNKYKLNSMLQKIVPVIFIGSIFLGSSIYLNAANFVSVFFGKGYGDVTEVLKIFSLALLVLPINYFLLNGIILPKSHDKQYREIFIVSAIVLFVGNLVLDKPFGFMGAAVAFIISEYTIFFYIIFLLRRDRSIAFYLIPFITSFFDYFFINLTSEFLVKSMKLSIDGIILFLLTAVVTSVYFILVHIIILAVYKLVKK